MVVWVYSKELHVGLVMLYLGVVFGKGDVTTSHVPACLVSQVHVFLFFMLAFFPGSSDLKWTY